MNVWHFLMDGGITERGGLQVVVGETMTCDPAEVVPCKFGFHGSVRALDALHFAPGPWVQYARLGGRIIAHGPDKHVASERTCLAMADATDVLREFGQWCAPNASPLTAAAAARVAAQASARDETSSSAWYAARDKLNEKLEEMLHNLLGTRP